ncbi:MAG: hypothetical protein HN576_13260 [Bacteriovoracaceae bacterium]|jgi:hypothetical protein|nr:hypothetical protein [Bacteriovoracaceae bacterium]
MTSKKTKELRRKSKGGPIATDEEYEKYPELFLFFYDELVDINDRKLGISPLNSDCYNKIKRRYENGEYPEHLRRFAEKELRLKIREN